MFQCYKKKRSLGGSVSSVIRFIALFNCTALISLCSATKLEFPVSFKFGAATSAYQVEGAWNISDKSESTWDHYTHTNSCAILDGSNGDVSCDSYHLWRRDIEMAAELKLNFYRFSISWPRLLPDGYSNRISEDGKNYYSNLIDGLLEKGIEPVVTLLHFDLPQSIQDLGGLVNPLITDWFAEYARVAYSLYADRVKTWITINEPIMLCDQAYSTGILAPGIVNPKIAPFICDKNVLIAHAKAWRIYDKEFKPKYHGKVTISNQIIWYEPYSPEDKNLTELVTQYYTGRYSHPIYSKEGGWPAAFEKAITEVSIKEGYPWSRLPKFTEDEIQLVKGTFDFFGINYYTSRLVRHARPGERIVGTWATGAPDLNAVLESDPNWPDPDWFAIYPEGLRKQLVWLKEKYGNIEIQITENGHYTKRSNLYDESRITFLQNHLEQVLLAVHEDGVNVTAYTYWALMDNFEWAVGYWLKFGLYEVDFSSPLRTRTPRASARFYKSIIQRRTLKHI